MEKRTSVFARLLALLALLAAIGAVYVVVSGGLDEDPAKPGKQADHQAKTEKEVVKPKITAKRYVVKSGDTLTRISYRTGVKVTRLIELNPEIDPQILSVGEVLKLR